MFRRSNILSDPNVSMAVLKDRVCHAVETEIQNEINDFEITDEEYIEISSKFWEHFYSCCEQYHIKACQPIGLVIMESVGAVCIVKKSTFSLLRPCEPLEHFMLVGQDMDLDHLYGSTSLALESDRYQDLIKLVSILSLLENQLPDEYKKDISDKLYYLEMPNIIVSTLVSEMLGSEYEENVIYITCKKTRYKCIYL